VDHSGVYDKAAGSARLDTGRWMPQESTAAFQLPLISPTSWFASCRSSGRAGSVPARAAIYQGPLLRKSLCARRRLKFGSARDPLV
jgi:hypothetical protein